MNYPCEMIRDLIPLYYDGACSEESRKAVEEHIRNCPSCRAFFQSLSEADTDVFVPEEEIRKADSFRSLKKKLRIRQAVAAVCTVILIAILFLAGSAVLKSRTGIISADDRLSVSMTDGSLIVRLYGNRADVVTEKRTEIDEDGTERTYLFFCMSGNQWDDLTTGKDLSSEYVLAPADKGADEIDAVYYYTGEYTGLENLNAEDLQKVIEESVLLWQTPEQSGTGN